MKVMTKGRLASLALRAILRMSIYRLGVSILVRAASKECLTVLCSVVKALVFLSTMSALSDSHSF